MQTPHVVMSHLSVDLPLTSRKILKGFDVPIVGGASRHRIVGTCTVDHPPLDPFFITQPPLWRDRALHHLFSCLRFEKVDV
jgi:hypothetical protein